MSDDREGKPWPVWEDVEPEDDAVVDEPRYLIGSAHEALNDRLVFTGAELGRRVRAASAHSRIVGWQMGLSLGVPIGAGAVLVGGSTLSLGLTVGIWAAMLAGFRSRRRLVRAVLGRQP